MVKVTILGTSNAISTPGHENTHMVAAGEERMVLVDCVSNPILRLEQAGLDFNDLTDIVITHFHPDHVSGLPLLLMDMWLMGRTRPIDIYGLQYTIDRIEKLMDLYSWSDWPDFFPVRFQRLPDSEHAAVLDCPDFKVLCTPVEHFIPTIGLRFDAHGSGKSLVYSCDTEPCAQMVRLASGADLLIHEASGEQKGHSSAAQAGEMAAKAGVKELCLIHYPTGQFSDGNPVRAAGEKFQGRIFLAEDYMALDL